METTEVKITRRADGLYVMKKKGDARADTAAKDRAVLKRIADAQGWTVVKQWSK